MPNERGWYTKEEVEALGLPVYLPERGSDPARWTDERYGHAVLMSKSRCEKLRMPVSVEPPSAFCYRNVVPTKYRYIPLYDRTDVFLDGELPYTLLLEHELMGKPPKKEEEGA